MPKLEAGGDYNFRLDGLPYNRGLFAASFEKTDTNKLKILNVNTGESISGNFKSFSAFTDASNNPYASRAALITALESFFF